MNPSRPPADLTVHAALAGAQRQGVDRLDAQHLLGHLLNRPRAWLAGHGDQALTPDQAQSWGVLLARWRDDVPMGYLMGSEPFDGLDLRVRPGVLVPRPDTQVVVDWAVELLGSATAQKHGSRVVDLGTGSGAIALAIKNRCPSAHVVATDASTVALNVARDNAVRLGIDVDWRAGSWWTPLAGEAFDLAVSNPPYLADGDPHLAALRHEPIDALTAGADGLDDLRVIVADAPARLNAGAWLLVEHGFDQGPAVRALFLQAGFVDVSTRHDLAGRPRSTGACWR